MNNSNNYNNDKNQRIYKEIYDKMIDRMIEIYFLHNFFWYIIIFNAIKKKKEMGQSTLNFSIEENVGD